MGRLLRLQKTRPDRAIHGYVYYRWTRRYMSLVRSVLERPSIAPRLREAGGRRLEQTHHAKVVPVGQARRVILLGAPVELRNLDRAVPYEAARDIVLEAPVRIALARCACREVAQRRGERDESRCGPLETCLYLGDPIAAFVVEHHRHARFVPAEEALEVLQAAADRGDVHTLWFKDAAGGRMYAICNCCTCCCIGLKAQRGGFRPLAPSGFLASADASACSACGACVQACPFDALSLSDSIAVDQQRCFGCGVCIRACPTGALRLESSEGGIAALPL